MLFETIGYVMSNIPIKSIYGREYELERCFGTINEASVCLASNKFMGAFLRVGIEHQEYQSDQCHLESIISYWNIPHVRSNISLPLPISISFKETNEIKYFD